MSVEIRINNQVADLSKGGQIDLELTNPNLTYETLFTQKATWPAVQMSPVNRRIFGFSDNLQVAGPDRFEVAMLYNGQVIQEGIGILGDTGQQYQLQMVEPLGEFFGIYQSMYLSEIAFGSIPMAAFSPLLTVNSEPAFCFPKTLNPDFFGNNGASIGYNGYVNDPGSSASPRCPAVFIKWLLQQIELKTGTQISGVLKDHPQLSQLILMSNRSMENATELVARNYLPNWTIGELLLQLRKCLNLSFNFQPARRKLSIGLTDTIFKQATQDNWSTKAVKGYKKREEPNRRLQLTFELDSKDALLKDRPASVADYVTPGTGAGIAKVPTRLCPLLVDQATGVQTMRQPGQTSQFAQGANDWQSRIAFWNGVTGGVGVALPSLGGIRLDWNGAGGLYDTFWKYTEAFRMGMFYAERSMLLNETDLASLDFSRKKHINGVDFVVARINVSLPVKKAAQCLLIRA
ncbi:hypothetical protein [Spirosoma rigui]|uniref:hypothetical protein n=1 Tax=Spirosoma rigui TaxID=564064 RepID=UPI0009B0224E|nr:hypothetical protein [Spirosoma rigui]